MLPLLATRTKIYDLGLTEWKRRKGDILRPDAWARKSIDSKRAKQINPSFQLYYQQDVGNGVQLTIKREHFLAFSPSSVPMLPIVLSVDCSQGAGSTRSFNVIQAWGRLGQDHFLLAQWREQCGYADLRSAYFKFVARYRPCHVLIEDAANGSALIADARRRARPVVQAVVPDGRPKAARLVEHIPTIRKRHILLPQDAAWRRTYIEELVEFPLSRFDDQVDATTQYLDFAATGPQLRLPEPRAVGALTLTGGRVAMVNHSRIQITQARGAVLARGRRW